MAMQGLPNGSRPNALDLKLDVRRDPGRTTIRVIGEVDWFCADKLKKLLLSEMKRGGQSVVDLSETRYMDSSGIKALEQAVLGSPSTVTVVTRPGSAVARSLSICGVDHLVNVKPTSKEVSGS
jgi:anti-anti-sigma factor